MTAIEKAMLELDRSSAIITVGRDAVGREFYYMLAHPVGINALFGLHSFKARRRSSRARMLRELGEVGTRIDVPALAQIDTPFPVT